MDRQALIERLQAAGMDGSLLTEAVPDALLAEMVRVLDAQASAPEGPAELSEHGPAAPEAPAELSEHGPAAPEAPAEATQQTAKDRPVMMSESQVAAIVARVIEGGASETIRRIEKFREEAERDAKAKAVDALVEDLVARGKLPPAERESERQGLLALDRQAVHKFSEGGRTVERTLFDHRVEQLKRRPSFFSEKLRTAADVAGTEDGEAAKVEAHFEAFSESFRKIGTTKDELVSAFKSRRKQDPELTADRFLKS